MKDQQIALGPFRLDEANECLWHEKRAISLRPKAYAVLRYLVQHPGKLVTKQQLLDDVWPNTFVSDAVLKDCVRQLREAFGDEAKSPRYIETAHRRGYRFIGPVSEGQLTSPAIEVQKAERFSAYPLPVPPPTDMSILGREEALAQMMGWLDKAMAAVTQVVFVTGEAGIGKTTVVEAFLQQARRLQDIWIARGQCLEQYGAGEAYLPVLECLSRLARGPARGRIIELLRANAPTWLAQMPSLTTPAEREALQEEVAGATRERMLREMSEAVESLTVESPLILVLEDLHWSDVSTLDLISYLARGRHPSRLMLIGTYRPVDVILNDHPLKDAKLELQMHKLCHELPLEYLTSEVVAEFLSLKFPAHQFPAGLSTMIHHRTEGNPLFMVNLVEYLIDEEIIISRDGNWCLQAELNEVELGVPEDMRYMIEKHVERLTPEEQRVLEGASVVGMDCSAAAMAAGLQDDVIKIEEICDGLARRHHFLRPAYLAELPDGTITPRYKFIHSLYLDVLYRRVAPTRRSQIHGRIGQRGEEIYGDRVGEIATELAVHFEQARDSERAVKYLQLAAENAARRSADHEVLSLASRGLEMLETLPSTPEREALKASLQELLSQAGGTDGEILH
jgi:predicted ATPase/DNA-binding winged helix-turn-helix (wHTH) protein